METLPLDIITDITLNGLNFESVLKLIKSSKLLYSVRQKEKFQAQIRLIWFESIKNKKFEPLVNKLLKFNKLDYIQVIVDHHFYLDSLLLLYCQHDRLDLVQEILRFPVIKSEPTKRPTLPSHIPRLLMPNDPFSPKPARELSIANPGSFRSESLSVACRNRNVKMVQELVADRRTKINYEIIEDAIDIDDEYTYELFQALYCSTNWGDRHTKEAYRIANGNGNEEILKHIEECEGWDYD